MEEQIDACSRRGSDYESVLNDGKESEDDRERHNRLREGADRRIGLEYTNLSRS